MTHILIAVVVFAALYGFNDWMKERQRQKRIDRGMDN